MTATSNETAPVPASIPAAMRAAMPATLATLGLVRHMSIEAYHGGAGLSRSQIEDFLLSPAHFWSRHIDPARPPAKKATLDQEKGTLLHTLLLEPDTFAQRYAIGPDVDRRTSEWKTRALEVAPRELIKPEEHRAALGQVAGILADPERRQLFARGEPEVSAYWRDEETGLLMRCRPDWVHPAGHNAVILIDAKTCGDASPAQFARQVARMGYHRQAALYSDGYGKAAGVAVVGFIFVAVETAWPYAASACILDDAGLDIGRAEVTNAIRGIAACMKENRWPGYEGIEQIELPRWAAR